MEGIIGMELIYEGKTKDVYRLEDGTIKLHFKDDVTGTDGKFDPGADTVGLSIAGAGRAALRVTTYFFEKVHKKNIPTHFIKADLHKNALFVKDATMFGHGLEFICRYRAVGSFYKRYGAYCKEGEPLDGFVEVTIKDDERNDPPITKDALTMLGIITEEEYDELKQLTYKIASIVKEELLSKGLHLYDIKFEFGRDKKTNAIMLIDEISGGNMRVFDENNREIDPLSLEEILLS